MFFYWKMAWTFHELIDRCTADVVADGKLIPAAELMSSTFPNTIAVRSKPEYGSVEFYVRGTENLYTSFTLAVMICGFSSIDDDESKTVIKRLEMFSNTYLDGDKTKCYRKPLYKFSSILNDKFNHYNCEMLFTDDELFNIAKALEHYNKGVTRIEREIESFFQ